MKLQVIILSLLFTGCAHRTWPEPYLHQAPQASTNSSIYDSLGRRIAVIDQRGRILGTQGAQAGRRIGQIK